MERNSFFPVGKEADRFKTTLEMHFFRLIISAKVCAHSKEKPDTVYSTVECFLYPSQGNPIDLRAPLPVKRALCAASSDYCAANCLWNSNKKDYMKNYRNYGFADKKFDGVSRKLLCYPKGYSKSSATQSLSSLHLYADSTSIHKAEQLAVKTNIIKWCSWALHHCKEYTLPLSQEVGSYPKGGSTCL